jgi:hypothetical protein
LIRVPKFAVNPLENAKTPRDFRKSISVRSMPQQEHASYLLTIIVN